MSRLASTGFATVLVSLAFSGAAYAQATPDTPPPPPAPDTTPPPDTTTTTTTTTTSGDVNASGTVNVDGTTTTTDATAPANVDVNVHTPDVVTTQPQPNYVIAPAPTVVVHEEEGPMSRIGVAIAAGGGAGGFVNDTLRNATDVGGNWDVRATIGTRSPIAFEGSYIGSAQGINALGLDNNAVLVGNGAQGALRLNATLDFPVQPFAYGGLAWRRYELTNTNRNLSDVRDNDDVLEVPLGVGIAGKASGLILDLRGEYRIARNADLIPNVNADTLTSSSSDFAAMNRWGVEGTIGIEF